jgi:four helix bundle protein
MLSTSQKPNSDGPDGLISWRKRGGMIRALFRGMDKHELQDRSLKFAVAIHQLAAHVRQMSAGRNAADQLSDCAASAAANYRAACRARSRAEFIAKLGTVVEEADEVVYWLEYIAETGLRPHSELSALLDESRQLRAIFAASYGTARHNHKTSNARRNRHRNL